MGNKETKEICKDCHWLDTDKCLFGIAPLTNDECPCHMSGDLGWTKLA